MRNFLFNLCLLASIGLQANDCARIASNEQLNTLSTQVKKQHFNENKIQLIQTFLQDKCVTCNQFKPLLTELSFEEDKIEVLKLVYKKLQDPANIGILLSTLEFDSSKKEIQNYIQGLK